MIVSKVRMYVLLALLGASLGLSGYLAFQVSKSHKGEAKANKELADLRQEATQKIAELTEQMREKETLMSRSFAAFTEQRDEKYLSVVRQRDALLKRVRLAEAKSAAASGVSEATGDPGTGQAPRLTLNPELLGSFGSTDVDEAARADLIREGLIDCYRRYDAVKQILNGN